MNTYKTTMYKTKSENEENQKNTKSQLNHVLIRQLS